jgi:hypothetical protein
MGNDMMGGMWIAGLLGLLLVVVLILATAALVKYLRAGKEPKDGPHE